MIVKERGVYTFRVPTHRDVEDWRDEPADKRQGAWAVRCLEHDQRTFFLTWATARDYARLPEGCPFCTAFDRRCTYCPSDVDRWLADHNTGFIPSVGYVVGNAVCEHHKYGAIPEGIDYEEQQDSSSDRRVIAIFAQETTGQRKMVVTIAFRPEEKTYCLQCHFGSEYVLATQAAIYSRALSFALSVASFLNEAAERNASIPPESAAFGQFETWGQAGERKTSDSDK